MRVFIWGAGNYAEVVLYSLKEDCKLIGMIDSNIEKQNTLWRDQYMIFSPKEALKMKYDVIIISTIYYDSILSICADYNVPRNKIVVFWRLKESNEWIDIRGKKIFELEKQCKIYEARLENKIYELGIGEFPIIRPAEELLKEILKKQKSLIRFGDGELEIMCKRERAWFQSTNAELSKRLNEVFYLENMNCLIAVSNNFGNLECYNENDADSIRLYLQGKRSELLKVIGTKRVYYDAYVSRPYIMYKDKENANRIFKLFKQIWENKKIIMVEGVHTRTGIHNDLFKNCKKIQRILCPATNAFDKYKEILESIRRNASKEDLILITLGPTATVLASDLSILGYQALDIGQLDNEYEWYKRKAEKRIVIPGKTVAEVNYCRKPEELLDEGYINQIIDKIV